MDYFKILNQKEKIMNDICPTIGFIRDHDIKYLLRRQPANTLCHGPADPWRWAALLLRNKDFKISNNPSALMREKSSWVLGQIGCQ